MSLSLSKPRWYGYTKICLSSHLFMNISYSLFPFSGYYESGCYEYSCSSLWGYVFLWLNATRVRRTAGSFARYRLNFIINGQTGFQVLVPFYTPISNVHPRVPFRRSMLQFSQCIHAEEDEVWNLIMIHYLTPHPHPPKREKTT